MVRAGLSKIPQQSGVQFGWHDADSSQFAFARSGSGGELGPALGCGKMCFELVSKNQLDSVCSDRVSGSDPIKSETTRFLKVEADPVSLSGNTLSKKQCLFPHLYLRIRAADAAF